MLTKDELPEQFNTELPAYKLLIPFADEGTTHKINTLFQIKYIDSNGYFFTTIGVMTIQVFNLIAKQVYIPEIKLPF